MADTTAGGSTNEGRTSLAALVYDPKARGIFFQVVIFGLLVIGLYLIVNNTIVNLQQLKKKFAPIKTLKQTRCNLEV